MNRKQILKAFNEIKIAQRNKKTEVQGQLLATWANAFKQELDLIKQEPKQRQIQTKQVKRSVENAVFRGLKNMFQDRVTVLQTRK